jgi:prolyl-tRNA synthetase
MTEKGIFVLMAFVVRAIDKLIEIINYRMVSINAQKLVMPTSGPKS